MAAYDWSGRNAVDDVEISVHAEPPSVINILMVGGFTNDSEYRLAWEGAERDPFIHHYEIQLDERGWADVGMNHSYQLSLDDVDEGDHVFHVKAVDKAGNAAVVVSVFVNVKKGLPISTLDLVVLLTLVILIIVTLIFWLKKKRGDRR